MENMKDKIRVIESPEYVQLQDELKEKIKVIKKQQKEYGQYKKLFSTLTHKLDEVAPKIKARPYKAIEKKGKIQEDAVLLLSDMHSDVEVKPERVQGFEHFDWKAVCHRAERVVNTTIDHLRNNMTEYNFPVLWIWMLGDMTSGEIHDIKRHSMWQNSMKSSMYTGALLARMFADLSEYFPKIKVVSISGNHGRRSTRIDWKAPQENWDYLTTMYAKSQLQRFVNDGRIEFLVPDSWSAVLNLYGYNFVLSHGHQNKQNTLGLPFYGLERRARRLISLGALKNVTYNYFIQGHNHTKASIEHPTGDMIINSSWVATDEFAFEQMAGVGNPTQLLFGVHKQYGATWRLPISLRSHNWQTEERRELKRYKIEI